MFFFLQIFDVHDYPVYEELQNWGQNHLEVLLGFYTEQQTSRLGRVFQPNADLRADVIQGQFLQFKRVAWENR